MNSCNLRQKFLKFFEKNGHKIISSSSLIPENDPSVLLTTAGMQQFKPYFAGDKNAKVDFGVTDLTSVQKSFRTSDIDEVGDFSHLTFFEMLGNFSIGGYGKKEAIKYTWELMTSKNWFNLPKNKFFATVFEGDEQIPPDTESLKIWQEIAPGIEIKKLGRADNFWPNPVWIGTCGPSTELHFKLNDKESLEIWNMVFTQFYHQGENIFKDLGNINIDTGMGLERLTMVTQNKSSIFETDLFLPIIKKIETLSKKKYGKNARFDRKIRIIADHARAITFLIADGVEPSSKDRGYILRRIIRRALTHAKLLNDSFNNLNELIQVVITEYKEAYPNIGKLNLNILQEEQIKFVNTLREGLKKYKNFGQNISGRDAFLLLQSFGFPIELTQDLAKEDGKIIDLKGFEEELKKHQAISRGE